MEDAFAEVALPDARTRLKEATAAQHHAVEAQLALHGTGLPTISTARYGRVLQGFAAFLAALEPRIAAALPAHRQAFFAPRRRLALVLADLHALGLQAPPPAEEALGIALAFEPHVFGALYVLEGSTLGGQVLCRALAQPLGLAPDHGLAYFHGHGTDTGAMWKRFVAALNAAVSDTPSLAQATTSARQTFDALGRTFARLAGPAAGGEA